MGGTGSGIGGSTNSKHPGTYKAGGLTLPTTVPKGGYGSVEKGWTTQQLQNLASIPETINKLNPNLQSDIAKSMNPANPGVAPIYSGPPPPTNPVTPPPPPPPPPYVPPSGPSGPMSGAAIGGGGMQGASWGPLAGYFSALTSPGR